MKEYPAQKMDTRRYHSFDATLESASYTKGYKMEVREIRSKAKGKRWTAKENADLRRMVDQGHDSLYIAGHIHCNHADVIAEIDRLGLDNEYAPNPFSVPRTDRECLSCGKVFSHRSNRICSKCKERTEFRASVNEPLTITRNRRAGGRP